MEKIRFVPEDLKNDQLNFIYERVQKNWSDQAISDDFKSKGVTSLSKTDIKRIKKQYKLEKQDLNMQKVVVTDFDMPFSSMMNFMLKWVLASIPAFIILVLFFYTVGMFLGLIF